MLPLTPEAAEEAGVQAYLRIDLAAVVANYQALRNRAKGRRCGAVVKADAYGVGLVPVVKALARAGCDLFFVAYPEEGQQVRACLGQAATVVVFNNFIPQTLPLFQEHHLSPVLNTPEQVHLYQQTQDQLPPCWLQVETGMHRSGLAENVPALDQITPAVVMSHYACADTPDHPLNARQLSVFKDWASRWPQAQTSLAASYGLFLASDYWGDIVRPGLALYGGLDAEGLKPVASLRAKVLEVRAIDTGQTVGYGATAQADQPMRIATLGIGYADGYPRHFSNQGEVVLADAHSPTAPLQKARLFGRVSMDLITVDVTHLPAIQSGDYATVYGTAAAGTLSDQAAQAGTISYELLTRLGHRYPRLYTE